MTDEERLEKIKVLIQNSLSTGNGEFLREALNICNKQFIVEIPMNDSVSLTFTFLNRKAMMEFRDRYASCCSVEFHEWNLIEK